MFNFKTAFRYAFSKTRGQRSTSIMIIFGIAAGLLALLVISAVMNGLQVAQLDQLRNLESFDLIINSDNLTKEQINNIEGVESAFNFLETNILIVDKTSGKSASSRARAYDQNIFTESRMNQSFYFLTEVSTNFDGILISYTTMNNLNIRQNHDIEITFLKRGKTATIVPYTTSIGISGFFSTRLTEFSSSTVFVNYEILKSIIGDENRKIGVYVSGNLKDVENIILSLDPEASITNWQEYNKALYSALMLEKTLIYIFLAFMFLIICVNLKNSTHRLLLNKQKEGAMLRALGCTKKDINHIFLGQGLIVCLIGEFIGVTLGVIIIKNLQLILNSIDSIYYFITGSNTVFALIPFNASISATEIILVCIFIFVISLLFTSLGCKKIYKSEIMEVILNASY